MRFFHVQGGANDEVNGYFESACGHREIEYVPVNLNTLADLLVDPPSFGDLLYNSGATTLHLRSEALLANEGVATFYRREDGVFFSRAGGKGVELFFLERKGLPVAKTVYYVDGDRRRLSESVREVGGFPVVLKAREGQWGMGVVMVDGFDSLVSTVEYMMERGERSLIMQEFVEHPAILRTITIGDRVVAGRRIKRIPGDFRTTTMQRVADRMVDAEGVKEVSPDMAEISIRATHASGVDFSGIDIIEASDGRRLVSEVNFPCIHAPTERSSGIPVSALMVDFLLEKSRRLSSEREGK